MAYTKKTEWLKRAHRLETVVRRVAWSVCAFAVVGTAGAAEIAFSGGGGDGDLASPANWTGGVLPGTDDVAVVDVGTSGVSYTLSAPVTFGGLVFTDNADAAVELASESTLTLGTNGLVCRVAGGIALKLPLAVAGEQTWNFGGGQAKFYKTIAGTDPLTLANVRGLWHYWSPRYDGKISYTGIKRWSNKDDSRPTHINFYEPDCKWANEIALLDWCEVRLLFGGPVSFAQLFPGMDPLSVGQGFGIEAVVATKDEGAAGGVGRPTLTVGAGEAVKMWQFCLGGGDMIQTNGSFTTQDAFWIGNNWYYNYTYGEPCHYYLKGGALETKTLNIGEYGRGVNRLVQSGGTVTVSSTIVMGGGNQTDENCLSEWCQDGGTVTVTSVSAPNNNYGTLLYYPEGQWGDGRALYELKGGTHVTPRLLFGTNFDPTPDTMTKDRGSHMPCHNSYGLFDLAGGTLDVGVGGIASGWNWNPDGWISPATNAYADVRLRKGTVRTGTSATTVPLRIPRSDAAVEWNTATDTAHTVFAPVLGDGNLVKTGAGTLALTDATAFNGSIEVREGSLRILGKGGASGEETAPVETGHDFWQWTGDAAQAAGATNGAAVSIWTDLQHGVAATNANIYLPHEGGKDVRYACPTLVAGAFNGHAALRFNEAMLTVPADVNPFVGAKEMTIVLAFKMTAAGVNPIDRADDKMWEDYYAGGTHMLNPGNGDYRGVWGPWFEWCSGNRLKFMVDVGGTVESRGHTVVSQEGVSLKDDVHVAVATVSEADGITLLVDGDFTNRVWTGAYHPLFNGYNNAKALPLMLGCLVSDAGNARTISGMHLGEMRIYTNALSRTMMSDLSAELYTKYNGKLEGLANVVSGCEGAVAGELVAPDAPVIPADLPAPAQRWTADSLAATHTDGAAVESWATTDGTRALAVEDGCTAPMFVAQSANGHAAVRFDADAQTSLGAPAKDVLAQTDWNNWTMAVVFRATEGATGRTGVMEGRGLVSMMKDETSKNAFQFALVTNGELRAYSSEESVFRRRPLRLDDGAVHVAVFTSDMAGRYCGKQDCIFVVDGIVNEYKPWSNPELMKTDAFRLRLGQLVNGKGFFSGEILEVRWYTAVNAPLTMEQTLGVCTELATTYGVPLYPRGNFGPGKVAAYGLGATNVSVAAGATLVLPQAVQSPYTVGAGQTLTLDGGEVMGPLVVSDGGTLRLTYGQMAEIESLKAVDAVRLDVVGLPSNRGSFTPLARVGTADMADANWTVVGHRGSTVEIRDGVLGVVSRNGTVLILR